LWNLLEKREAFREAFSDEKTLKTNIYAVRFAIAIRDFRYSNLHFGHLEIFQQRFFM
jgi:hypothetical protein